MKKTGQRVRVYGNDAVMQFSMTGNGSRTFKTGVHSIREATQSEIDEITDLVLEEKEFRHSGTKTRLRRMPLAGLFRIYVGISEPVIWDGKRKVKVWGQTWKKDEKTPDSWFSYDAIFEDGD